MRTAISTLAFIALALPVAAGEWHGRPCADKAECDALELGYTWAKSHDEDDPMMCWGHPGGRFDEGCRAYVYEAEKRHGVIENSGGTKGSLPNSRLQ